MQGVVQGGVDTDSISISGVWRMCWVGGSLCGVRAQGWLCGLC